MLLCMFLNVSLEFKMFVKCVRDGVCVFEILDVFT